LAISSSERATLPTIFLSLRFDDRDVSRMNELSELAQMGALGTTDAAELDCYIHVSNLLAVMQSKARRSLRNSEE